MRVGTAAAARSAQLAGASAYGTSIQPTFDPIIPDAYTGPLLGQRAASAFIVSLIPSRSSVTTPEGAEYSSIAAPSDPMRYARKFVLPQFTPTKEPDSAPRDT